MNIKGTELFVKALIKEGVEIVFAYPGAATIDIMDELYIHNNEIEIVLPRHEQGLAHAADGYARSSGNVGVCIVTSGPGATNLVTAIATANYDSVPMVCFTGQVATHLIGNDAFQEVDIVGITRNICKYGVTVRNRNDLGRIIKEAFYIARTGKPGPVIVDLPKDIMNELGEGEYPKTVNIRGYKPSNGVHVGQIKKAMELLKESKRPVFLVGGGVHVSNAGSVLSNVVNITKVPVITTIMGKGSIATDSPYYVGNIGMHGSYAANTAISKCDILFSMGTRFNDRITGKVSEFATNAKIVHIDIDTASISRNIKVDIPIVGDIKTALESMMKYASEIDTNDWMSDINSWKETIPAYTENDMSPKSIFGKMNEHFKDAIFVTDVGQHQMWTTQFLEMRGDSRIITSGGLGTMGYGLPAAIGAKMGVPNKNIVCITGDGGVQMNIQEIATAVVNELAVIICIFNNGYLGMVRQWQQLFYDNRYAATCLKRRKSCSAMCKGPSENCPPYSPDFMKLAESYGAKGIRISKYEDIDPAFNEAKQNINLPTVIEFMIDYDNLVLPMVESGKSIEHMILGN